MPELVVVGPVPPLVVVLVLMKLDGLVMGLVPTVLEPPTPVALLVNPNPSCAPRSRAKLR